MEELMELLLNITFILTGVLLSLAIFLIGFSFSLLEGLKFRIVFKYVSIFSGTALFIIMIFIGLINLPILVRLSIISSIGAIFAFVILSLIVLLDVKINWKKHKITLTLLCLGTLTGIVLVAYASIFRYSDVIIPSAIVVLGMTVVSFTFFAYLSIQRKAFYDLLRIPTICIILLAIIYLNIIALSLYYIAFLDEFYIVLSIVGFFFSLFMFLDFLITYYGTKYHYTRAKSRAKFIKQGEM